MGPAVAGDDVDALRAADDALCVQESDDQILVVPLVRIVTVNAIPASRISSGSSTA